MNVCICVYINIKTTRLNIALAHKKTKITFVDRMESRISGVILARTITVILPTVKHGGGNMFIWGCKYAHLHLWTIQ